MTTLVTRAPAGIPTGGQFTRHARAAAASDMLVDDADNLDAGIDTAAVVEHAAESASQQGQVFAVKRVARAIRTQWPDAEHAYARIEPDNTITITHVLDAFEGLHADEESMNTRLGDGTWVPVELSGVNANGDWTKNAAKPMLYGGPPKQKTLRIDLYEAAALRTAPEQRLDLARDEVGDTVLAQYPDADGWEAEFRYDWRDERFTVDDNIYVSAGDRYARLNLADQDPALLAELSEAANGALTDIDEDTRYCARIPGPYLTADDHQPF